MYERSAIVLESYFEKVLGLNNENNLKDNYDNYNRLIEEIKEYQRIVEEEENVIRKFEESASEIEAFQNKQKKLYNENMKVEEERNELFNDLGENTSTIDQRLQKIEDIIEKNNESLKDLREKYVKALIIFTERQKERNKYARLHRTSETSYLSLLKQIKISFEKFDYKNIKNVKKFMDNYISYNEELVEKMLKNGRNERIPFDEEVIKIAVEERSKIAKEEASLYISIYERMKKLIAEVNSGMVRLAKSEKLLRDVSVKLAFLRAKKDYIVVFLDNERMTAMNGKKVHARLMEEACKNFLSDIEQIDNLYELIQKETLGKATKKAYKELYNKTYLKEIEEKEKDFEEEATNIKINMGTLINANYWRIEGVKNVYNTFQEEVGEKFNKDLSEYKLDESKKELDVKDKIKKSKSKRKTKEEKQEEVINYNNDDESDYEKENENYYEDEDDEYQDVIFDEEEEEAEFERNRIDNYEEDDDYYYDDDWDEYDENDVEPYRYNYEDEEDDDEYEEDIEEDDEITEEKIEQIIKDSRKNNKKNKEEKGLFGKLFKK